LRRHLLLYLFLFTCTFCSGQNWLWGVQGHGNTEGWAVATDFSGNAYLTGYSATTLIFGTDTLPYLGHQIPFLVKYSPTGNIFWARCGIPSGFGYSTSITTDMYGNAYMFGNFVDTITFGLNKLIGSADCFLVKYSPTGNVLWARQSNNQSLSECTGESVCTDKNGNVCITGSFTDTISFGAFQLRLNHPG